MQIIDDIEQNTPEWLARREGKITGKTNARAMTGKKWLKDFWGLLAYRVVTPSENEEESRDRGHRLEDEACMLAAKQLGVELYEKKVAMCISDDNPDLAYSPDWLAAPVDGKFTADFEAKCFEAPAHLEHVVTNTIPDKVQMLRPFTVNPDLQTRYYVFYHDRVAIPELRLHIITVERKDHEDDIAALASRDAETFAELDNILRKYF